ncbi:MAG TPA: DUF1906 domain-containing protein [Streptosporangiaceae bacterium]
MSRFGVDYSFARPTPSELKAAGVTFACRYIGTPSSGKNLTLAEADALRAAGIDLVANFEAGSAGWMQGGRTAGVNAAKAAHADATRLGMPASRPIYFSADFNATFDQYKTQVKPCLEGAASVIGTSRVGIYGGLEQVDWAFRDGVSPWVWQTYAWSYGQWSSHGHIQQYKNGQKLGSGTVDYDRAVQADFGQWSAQGDADMPLTDDDVTKVANAVLKKLSGPDFMGARWDDTAGALTFTELLGKYEGTSLYKQLDAILAAVKASGGEWSPQQIQDLGSAIADRLIVTSGGYTLNLTGEAVPKATP